MNVPSHCTNILIWTDSPKIKKWSSARKGCQNISYLSLTLVTLGTNYLEDLKFVNMKWICIYTL